MTEKDIALAVRQCKIEKSATTGKVTAVLIYKPDGTTRWVSTKGQYLSQVVRDQMAGGGSVYPSAPERKGG